MPLRLAFAASLQKAGYNPDENEDCYLLDSETATTRFALSDGATHSYDSRGFARLLCEQWLKRSHPVIPLRSAQRAYEARFAGVELSWSDAAALEVGSYATLIGASVEGDLLKVVVVGDSLLVYLPPAGGGPPVSIPYQAAAEFEQSPLLLSTRPEKLRRFNLSFVRRCSHSIGLQPGGKLVCMTDALGAWYLAADNEQRLRLIERIRSPDEFSELVEGERLRGAMKNDDYTLLIFDVAEL